MRRIVINYAVVFYYGGRAKHGTKNFSLQNALKLFHGVATFHLTASALHYGNYRLPEKSCSSIEQFCVVAFESTFEHSPNSFWNTIKPSHLFARDFCFRLFIPRQFCIVGCFCNEASRGLPYSRGNPGLWFIERNVQRFTTIQFCTVIFCFHFKKLTNQISPQAKILDTLTIVEQNCICKMSELDI